MDFKDQLKQLGERVAKMKDQILTEEATKTALIMPFINTLGYDVFNPYEVSPEFVADIGIKKGEKVDYAILQSGKPIILIECKHWSSDLNPHNSQLFRYFHTTEAKFGILTNGICYRFYTDLVQPNKMDEKPFFEFNVDQLKDIQIDKLKEFHKSYFNIESINNSASELKYMNEIRGIIVNELTEPSDEFVRHFAKSVYPSVITSKVLEQFRNLVKRSFSSYINDSISDRLNHALATTEDAGAIPDPSVEPIAKIITTPEEMEAYFIVRAILRSKVDIARVAHRDGQTYFSVLLDDNNRKPICRLYLEGKKKSIVLFNGEREERHEIKTISDIYSHSDNLLNTVEKYVSLKV